MRCGATGSWSSWAPASAVLDGHPADGVAWLANVIGAYGRTLHAGEVVLSGALMRAVPAEQGDLFEARFPELGVALCRFV